MGKYLIILMLLLFPLPVMAYTWDTQDTVLQVLVVTSLAIDRHQTRQINSKGFEECGWARSWIGSHPSNKEIDTYFAGAAIGHTAISIILPKHWIVGSYDIPVRTIWQSFWFGVEFKTVRDNYVVCGLTIGIN